MYILKNALVSITRNKGRNILIGIIILVIACSSTITLAIRNTANQLVRDYEESHNVMANISFDRNALTKNFKGGEDAQKENIEAFNNIESLHIEDVKNYADSTYLKDFYYLYATSLNSDTLTKATDSYEYEVEDKQTTTSSSTTTTGGNFGKEHNGGERHTTINNNTTTIITKSKEVFQSARNFTGDFEIDGYSSYDAMTSFLEGTYKVTEGEMFSAFDIFECVISEELATLNEINVGDKIRFTNPNDSKKTYEFTVTGIYTDNSSTDDTQNMYSLSANKIITGSEVIEKLVEEDSTLVTDITPTFILNSKEDIEAFTNEVKEKGLNEYYTVSTNLEELQTATHSIENVKTFATTFLIITLIIAGVVLFVINMINIRERKYEIGVLRTIGMKKSTLTFQFLFELLLVSFIALAIGAGIGSLCSVPVSNHLLESEIANSQEQKENVNKNFGEKMPDAEQENRIEQINGVASIEAFDSMNATVDIIVVLELFGIGALLTLVSSLASMISIQKFSPLTILKERS